MAPRERTPARRSAPWSRERMGWANGLGFALSLSYALWLLLAIAGLVLSGKGPTFTLPLPYVLVGFLALAATIVFCGVIVFGFAWRGADFHEAGPRMYLLLWSASGLFFFLVTLVTRLRFGNQPLPGVPPWAAEIYWAGAFVGLPCFALMVYANSAPAHGQHDDYDDDDPDYDEDQAYEEDAYA